MGSLTAPLFSLSFPVLCLTVRVSQMSSNLPSSLWQAWIAFLTYALPRAALAVISTYGKGRCLTGMPMEKTFTMQRKILSSSNRKLGERALRGLNRERQHKDVDTGFGVRPGANLRPIPQLLVTWLGEYYITLSFSMICLNGGNKSADYVEN